MTAGHARPPERLHALDAVRGFALILGIVFHTAGSFLVSAPGNRLWDVTDKSPSLTLGVVFFVLHIFRMTTFFLIAGFFAHLTLHRRGTKGFVRDRLQRIALPLVAYWGTLATIAVVGLGAVSLATHKPFPEIPERVLSWHAFPLIHLWFLYVLLWFYVIALAARALVVRIDPAQRLRGGIDAIVRALVRNPLGPILLAAPLFAVFALRPEWRWWLGITTPDKSLVTDLSAAVGYGTAFAFGFLVHRQPDLIRVWEKRWALNLIAALALTAAAFAIVGVTPSRGMAPDDWRKLAYAGVYTLAIWAWTFAAIGMALRFLSGYSAFRRYVADSSYWLYLIHLPLVLIAQAAVAKQHWPWWIKFPLILAVIFPLMFWSYNAWVRHTFIGWMLNGRKQPRPERKVKPV